MTEKKKYQPLDAMKYPRFEGIRTFMRLPHKSNLDEILLQLVSHLIRVKPFV